jgi:predicted lipoprotein
MSDDMTPLLKSDQGYRSLQLLQLDVERLATQLSGIAAELGIVRGFNSSDGD